jgi:hypothetical protein
VCVTSFVVHFLLAKSERSIQASQYKPGKYRKKRDTSFEEIQTVKLIGFSSPTVGGSELHSTTPFVFMTKEKGAQNPERGGIVAKKKSRLAERRTMSHR